MTRLQDHVVQFYDVEELKSRKTWEAYKEDLRSGRDSRASIIDIYRWVLIGKGCVVHVCRCESR